MRNLPGIVLFPLLALALIAAILAGVCWGSYNQPPPIQALAILAHQLGIAPDGGWSQNEMFIVLNVRLPRVLVAATVGGGLALSGCCLQGLFNNPLASPDVLGLSSGGAFGAVGAIFLGLDLLSPAVLPLFAFVGAFLAALLVYALASRRGRTPVATLLLAGIAVNAMLGAAVSMLLILRIEEVEAARKIVFWLIGGLESRLWSHLAMSAPPIIVGSILAVFLARDLNSLSLGEETAQSLGVSVQRFKIELLALVAVVTGASVAVSGVLAFVGLIVPHMIRLIIGPDHRRLLPACVLGGGAFLALVDLISRTMVRPGEIRIGILMSLVGGPFFLFLLIYHQRKAEAM